MTQGTKLSISIFALLLLNSPISRAADQIVTIKEKKFTTKSVEVSYGDSLVFKNEETDGSTHSIYSLTAGYEFDLKAQKPGETKTLKIEKEKLKPGRFEVGCAVHPDQPDEQKLQVHIKDK